MKKIIIVSLVIFVLSQMLYAAEPQKENKLTGTWKLVKAETNGKPNPQIVMDRDWTFYPNNIFEGKMYINGVEKPFNSGMFFLPNDTTMITLHYTPDKKLYKVAYTYNFHIQNDSLHFYGVYFNRVLSEPTMLQMIYIDEWWIKQFSMPQK